MLFSIILYVILCIVLIACAVFFVAAMVDMVTGIFYSIKQNGIKQYRTRIILGGTIGFVAALFFAAVASGKWWETILFFVLLIPIGIIAGMYYKAPKSSESLESPNPSRYNNHNILRAKKAINSAAFRVSQYENQTYEGASYNLATANRHYTTAEADLQVAIHGGGKSFRTRRDIAKAKQDINSSAFMVSKYEGKNDIVSKQNLATARRHLAKAKADLQIAIHKE